MGGDSDIDNVHRLKKGGSGLDLAGVDASLDGRHNLTSTTMDSIGMHNNIHNVDTDTTHALLGDNTGGSDLDEGTDNGILDLIQVLHTLGGIDDHVRNGVRRATKGPDLSGLSHIPLEIIG
jgi:hypothetical protein